MPLEAELCEETMVSYHCERWMVLILETNYTKDLLDDVASYHYQKCLLRYLLEWKWLPFLPSFRQQ